MDIQHEKTNAAFSKGLFVTCLDTRWLKCVLPNIKYLCFYWLLQVKSFNSINSTLQKKIHPCSCTRWKALHNRTCEVVRHPANYDPCGSPPSLTNEEVNFLLVLFMPFLSSVSANHAIKLEQYILASVQQSMHNTQLMLRPSQANSWYLQASFFFHLLHNYKIS
ncbi:hypothetical protein VP01_735g3 [Puccinia sorghi]|uniref:Uncharacterized protein n=1 Tax=Puccinia sorghi TaxID=27349 RepID=A0A0L6UCQ9_9BASI|nr:hypothetical protein VP01_735g3 [Puccinia sorghi]